MPDPSPSARGTHLLTRRSGPGATPLSKARAASSPWPAKSGAPWVKLRPVKGGSP